MTNAQRTARRLRRQADRITDPVQAQNLRDRADRIDAPEAPASAPAPLPADWDVWHDERYGWAVSRDHGSLVVGLGYISRAQAMDVARRTLAQD
jgi:hypothetical protein